jgi:uncharacterized protein involved in response to NO
MRRFAAAPVFSLGFRPFFLAGAGFGAIAVGLWAVWLYGHLPTAQPPGGMLAWHRHEMPFGFAGAIIAGFLLTAVPNWTGRPGRSEHARDGLSFDVGYLGVHIRYSGNGHLRFRSYSGLL